MMGSRLKRWMRAGIVVSVLAVAWRGSVSAQEDLVLFDFSGSTQDWTIPGWEKDSADYVAKGLVTSTEFASHGEGSLRLWADFPGEKWTGAYAEIEMRVVDWTPFGTLAVDVYLPADAPAGLTGRFILTVGDQWQWTEMNRPVALKAGQWTTIKANLKPGSMDWKFFPEDAFRQDIRKVGVRIESNHAPAYTGPIFLDNVQLLK